MSRKTPLPASEAGICRRIGLFRKRCDIPRRLFSRDLGIDSSSLARIELCRVPLKYGVAFKLFSAFAINPVWVATGEGPLVASIPIPSPESVQADPNALFTEIFSGAIGEEAKRRSIQLENDPALSYGRAEFQPDPKGRVIAEAVLRHDIAAWFEAIPDGRFNDLVNRIRLAAMPLVYDWNQPNDSSKVIAKRREAMKREREAINQRRETKKPGSRRA
jgi:hypothetical protein